jgi:hypothetical protein
MADKCGRTFFIRAQHRLDAAGLLEIGGGKMKKKVETRKAKTAREEEQPETVFVVLWWHFQKPYVAVVPTYDEAKWIADTRNGVIVEVLGRGVAVKSVVDFYRRDEAGNPMPAEMRPYESPNPNALVRAQ